MSGQWVERGGDGKRTRGLGADGEGDEEGGQGSS